MAKHRADKPGLAGTPNPGRHKARHRRHRGLIMVAPVAALTLVAGGGVAAVGAGAGPDTVGLEGASSSWAAEAAVMASRQELISSRSGARLLLGADRLDAIKTQERSTLRKIKAREARQKARQEARERAAEERRQQRIEARQWGAPLDSYTITARFGDTSYLWSSGRHTGLDFNNVTGTPVHPVGPGTVTSAGWDGAYGNKIVVEHPDGTETWYCHLSAINVSVGQSVTHKTVIGLLGATGNVTGDHLHLELRPAGGGDPMDPAAGLAASHGLHF